MIKIGLIDYFLNNYHARNYPAWIHDYSNGRLGVTCAYASSDCTDGGMTNIEWSRKYGIPLLTSAEDVISQSDCIMVLSPSHPEMHDELCTLALKSGKRVYVDKAFAPDLDTAKRMFDMAEKYGTPCCSSSALAFVTAYESIKRDKIQVISSKGGGSFEVYAIHQFEPVVAMMGGKTVRVMSVGDMYFPSFIIEFDDGRIARTEQFAAADFEMYVGYNNGTAEFVRVEEDIFKGFIMRVIEFFETGRLVAEHQQTLAVIALLDAAQKAMENPFSWVNISNFK